MRTEAQDKGPSQFGSRYSQSSRSRHSHSHHSHSDYRPGRDNNRGENRSRRSRSPRPASMRVQTNIEPRPTQEYSDMCGSISQGFPYMLQTLAVRESTWAEMQTNGSIQCSKDVISCVQLLALQLAIDIHPYFLEHHNQILNAAEPTWQKCEEEDCGQFYHFAVHKEGSCLYAVDFLQNRTEAWPYGVRVCGLDRH